MKPTFRDKSWANGSSLLYKLYYGDANTLRNNIGTLYSRTYNRLVRFEEMRPEFVDDEQSRLIEDWFDLLREFARDITYWEASDVYNKLWYLCEEIIEGVEEETAAIQSQPRAQPQAPIVHVDPQPRKKDKKPKARDTGKAEEDDDLAFAQAMLRVGGSSAAASRRRPSNKVTKKSTWKPPTPAEEWQTTQRGMEQDWSDANGRYNQILRAGRSDDERDHVATQDTVLRELDLTGSTANVWQVRPDKMTNDQKRIYFTEDDGDFWAWGLSHDGPRRSGTFMVYKRVSRRNFTFVSGRRHHRDINV